MFSKEKYTLIYFLYLIRYSQFDIHSYVLSAPSKMLDTLPGTLMLTDCLEACQSNESCSSVNYETGLCVLFKTTADKLPGELESVRISLAKLQLQLQQLLS